MIALLLTSLLTFAKDTPLDVKDLPPAVKASVMKKYPGATIVKAEKDDGKFELEIHVGSAKHEMYVEPDGTIRKEKLKD